MKISFFNIGCKVNFADMSQIEEQFIDLGHSIVPFGEESDAIFINTCTVTGNADADCRKIIRRAHRQSPEAFIGVMGCYAQLSYNEIMAIEGVDCIFGTNEKFNIPELIEKFEKKKTPEIFVANLDNIPFHSSCSVDNDAHTRKALKLQDGCDYNCSYCTIPLARGASRSMNFTELRDKLIELDKEDIYEIVLSGINLGEYKAPSGETFSDVIRLINSIKPKQRFRISSIEPNLLSDEILELTATSPNPCKHFHIPLQSGSPEILRLMRRRYKAEDFEELILKIKKRIPDCCIGVDVIVGFPGETDILFKETYTLLERLPISHLHVFTYSERDNTPASGYDGAVKHDVRKHRTHQLRELSDMKLRAFYKSQIGKTQQIIPERYDAKTSLWSGWTEHYVKVKFKAGKDLHSKFYQVKLEQIEDDYVLGSLIGNG